jgi:16S rRNA (uracil1498-N3)-methyltransferase
MPLRVFHDGAFPAPGAEFALAPAESRHLVRVRRARSGDPVDALDGRGAVAHCQLVDESPDAARLRVAELVRSPAPVPLVLAVGLPKGAVFEEIVRAATELGATAVQPLFTARVEVRLDDPARAAQKLRRARAAALDALKQSGNPWLPEIHPPLALAAWLISAPALASARKFVAALTPAALPLYELDLSSVVPPRGTKEETNSIILAVGPEGDFTPAEYDHFAAAGFLPLRLPGSILRVETACAAGLALLG